MNTVDPMDFLLGELDEEGTREAERLMRSDAAFRDEVERLRPIVTALEELPDEAWDPPVPPPLRHPDAIAEAPAPAPRRRPAPRGVPWWRRLSVPVPAVGLATVVALATGIGIGTLVTGRDEAPPAPQAVADVRLAAFGQAPAAAGGDARILAGGQLSLQVHDLAPSTSGEFYTAWLLGKDGRLVPLGSFRIPASGAATVRLPLPVQPGNFDYVDVSVEPDDGDPGHSGKSVLRGPTA